MVSTQQSTHRIVEQYVLRQVIRRVCASTTFQNRSASLRDLTPAIMEAFGQGFLLQGKGIRLAGIGDKIKKLWGLFKKAPQMWEEIKEFLGIKGLLDAPKRIKDWASKGLKALKTSLGAAIKNNPFVAMYVIPKAKMPGITDMLHGLSTANAKLKAGIEKAQSFLQPLEEIIAGSKIGRNLARPLLAAAFIYVWLHVAELSWDIFGIIKGFTGGVSLSELLGSLPESGLGFLFAMLFPGLGTFALLPATILARLSYLLIKKIVYWVAGKGFLVNWDKLGMPERGKELVPAF